MRGPARDRRATRRGKTYTSLLLAKLLIGRRQAARRTEEQDLRDRHGTHVVRALSGRVRLRDHRVAAPFHGPADYKACIVVAETAGAEVIILDSVSHEWQWCLQEVDRLAPKRGGNTWSAWGAVRPPHDDFVDAMMGSSAHIIATLRAAPETVQRTENGRTKVETIGMKQIQDSMFGFAFTIVIHMDGDHTATVVKTRCRAIDKREFPMPGEQFMNEVKRWLDSGAPAVPIVHTLADLCRATERAMLAAADAKNKEHYQDAIQNFGAWCKAKGVPDAEGLPALAAVQANVKAAIEAKKKAAEQAAGAASSTRTPRQRSSSPSMTSRVRCLALADSHFSGRPGGKLAECEAIHPEIADKAAAHGATLTVHAGDLAHAASTPDERAAEARVLTRLAAFGPVVLVRGNHDTRRDLAIFRRLRTVHPILVAEEPSVFIVAGVAVACLPWPDIGDLTTAARALGGTGTAAEIKGVPRVNRGPCGTGRARGRRAAARGRVPCDDPGGVVHGRAAARRTVRPHDRC